MSVYNKNRDNNLSLHDEIKEQNAKMKGQPLSVKLGYFKDYYLKITLVVIVIIVAAIGLIVSIVNQPDDTAFAGYFINCSVPVPDDTLINQYIDESGIDTKKHDVYLETSLSISEGDTNQDPYAYVAIEKVMAIISTGELDVIVGDDVATNYYADGDCFLDITTVLPKDLLDKFQNKLYYYTREDGTSIPVGIYIDDSSKLQDFGYYKNQQPIFGIIANSNSVDNAISFLRFLYE